jgi:transcriptional regulator with XRE-family HTH domain
MAFVVFRCKSAFSAAVRYSGSPLTRLPPENFGIFPIISEIIAESRGVSYNDYVGKDETEDFFHDPEGSGFDTFSDHVRRRVRVLRKQQGLSVEALAERCQNLGLTDFNPSLITSIELGRKQNISIDEWLGLALALDVSPLHVVIPIDSVELCYLAGRIYQAGVLRQWVRGLMPLDVTNSRTFFTSTPEEEWAEFTQRGVGEGVVGKPVIRPLSAGEMANAERHQPDTTPDTTSEPTSDDAWAVVDITEEEAQSEPVSKRRRRVKGEGSGR